MTAIDKQPTISVGIISGAAALEFSLEAPYAMADGTAFVPGTYRAKSSTTGLVLEGGGVTLAIEKGSLKLQPLSSAEQSFLVASVQIGIGFHWQRNEDQRFTGALELVPDANGRLSLVNVVGVEDYLASVISSEMSANSHPELLKAHAITSRSWLLAQLAPWKVDRGVNSASPTDQRPGIKIRWYDRENHDQFDVCADDHCQRYQGVTKATTAAVSSAVNDTWGSVLTFNGEICDARFSKSCGGMTEEYRAAWQDVEIPYLSARVDAAGWPDAYGTPLTAEANARAWIAGDPSAFCRTNDAKLLAKILPGFDQETADFYRWNRRIGQDELQALLDTKLGIHIGAILSLDAIERGHSGRIIQLRITGGRDSVTIGKELEIRRALSASHLYSSALSITAGPAVGGTPTWFDLRGAGWGHGVGLCQIGAAAMAEGGWNSGSILAHYFLNAELEQLYSR